MKKILLTVFIFLLVSTARADSWNDSMQHVIDSLEHQLNTCTTDSGKAVLNNKIVVQYFAIGISSDLLNTVQKFNADAIELCRKISFQTGLAEAILMRGKMGLSFRHDFGKATNDFLESKKIYTGLNDSCGISKCYLQLGLISYLLQYHEEAVKCFSQSLDYNKKADQSNAQANYLTALSYIELHDYNNSENFFKRAITIYEKIGGEKGTHGIIECYTYMAKMYVMSDRIDFANNCFSKIDTLTKFRIDEQTKARLLAVKCGAFLKLNQIENAILAGLEAHKIADAYDDELTNSEADLHLFRAFELKGDFKNAFHYLYELKNLSDSLYSLNAGQRVAEIRTKYEFDNQLLVEKQQQERKGAIAQNEIERQKIIRNSTMGILGVAVVFLIIVFRQRRRIDKAKQRSEELLLNILPAKVAEELKNTDKMHAEHYDMVTVLFTDFKDFTKVSADMSASELVTEINFYFSAFDRIISKYNIEKIKTIGDSYMCVSGVPRANPNHAIDIVNVALDIQQFVMETAEKRKAENKLYFELRCGVHSGPVVAGVVGVKKFAYDIWGDTVNIASRMESGGETGKVNISGTTYELIKHKFNCTYRGKMEVKNRGVMDMYFIENSVSQEA